MGTDVAKTSSACILPSNPSRTLDAPKQALNFFSSEKNKRLEDGYFDQASEICEVDVDEDELKAKRSSALHFLNQKGYFALFVVHVPPINCTENENKGVIGSVSKTTRGHRVAVRTKEVLDNGYRSRKYGMAFGKGSPHPRFYYKCLTKGCSGKKWVQRDYQDTRFLITTYEGVHVHGCYNMGVYNLHTPLCNDHMPNYVEDAADLAKTISPTKGGEAAYPKSWSLQFLRPDTSFLARYEDVFEASIQDMVAQPEYEGIPEASIRDESQQSGNRSIQAFERMFY
ncbi:probable WRKY transcription factor 10 [Durio zibethinus]|uniref:Probable WRKY transcription factor 10 n=1 Tax=Durio zibethinus TaxID=66656 RepID=A0A6P5ZSR4_DURZI|nr:probable WRKY transcription factor 10 [Durio zibethinus]